MSISIFDEWPLLSERKVDLLDLAQQEYIDVLHRLGSLKKDIDRSPLNPRLDEFQEVANYGNLLKVIQKDDPFLLSLDELNVLIEEKRRLLETAGYDFYNISSVNEEESRAEAALMSDMLRFEEECFLLSCEKVE